VAYSPSPNFTTGAIVTEAQLDTLSDNITSLADPPRVRVYNSANIATATATPLALTFNSERFDTDTMHSTAVNTSRITFTTGGYYMIGAGIEFASNATGYRSVTLRISGATEIACEVRPAVSGAVTRVSISTLWGVAAGAYVECIVDQNSGGALNVNATASHSPEFWAIHQAV
jgi:hypothetical protein